MIRRLAVLLTAATLVATTAPAHAGPTHAEPVHREPASVTIATTGNGHGKGLSQYGALHRAREGGQSYREIVEHYYPGTTWGTAAGSIRVLEKTGFSVIEQTTSVVERHRGKPLWVMEWRG